MDRNEKRDEFLQMTAVVKDALGYAEVVSDPEWYALQADIVRGDEDGLGVSFATGPTEGRLTIRPVYGKLHPYMDRDHWVSITVADTKSAAQIARDITNRLLPAMDDGVAKARQRRQETLDYAQKTAENAARLLAASNGKLQGRAPNVDSVRNGDSEWHLSSYDGLYLAARCYGESVTFEHLSLTVDQAERVFAALFAA